MNGERGCRGFEAVGGGMPKPRLPIKATTDRGPGAGQKATIGS